MAQIINVFKEKIPTMRFIGKKYDNFGYWGEWWQNGWFDLLENAMCGTDKIISVWKMAAVILVLKGAPKDSLLSII